MASKKPIILMVDDEKTVLDSLTNQLRGAFGRQFRYEPALTMEEAWEVLDGAAQEQLHIALIISDWMMPQQKGDIFLAEVHQKYPEIPKVMLSGFADQDSVERAKAESNLLAYIAKPWEPQQITELVAQLPVTKANA